MSINPPQDDAHGDEAGAPLVVELAEGDDRDVRFGTPRWPVTRRTRVVAGVVIVGTVAAISIALGRDSSHQSAPPLAPLPTVASSAAPTTTVSTTTPSTAPAPPTTAFTPAHRVQLDDPANESPLVSGNPLFSPNGDFAALLVRPQNLAASPELRVFDLRRNSGAPAATIPVGHGMLGPRIGAWSPDGQFFFFTTDTGLAAYDTITNQTTVIPGTTEINWIIGTA